MRNHRTCPGGHTVQKLCQFDVSRRLHLLRRCYVYRHSFDLEYPLGRISSDSSNTSIGTGTKYRWSLLILSVYYRICCIVVRERPHVEKVSSARLIVLSAYTPGANLTYLAPPPPRTIFHGCQIVHWDPRNAKNFCPQR